MARFLWPIGLPDQYWVLLLLFENNSKPLLIWLATEGLQIKAALALSVLSWLYSRFGNGWLSFCLGHNDEVATRQGSPVPF